MNQPKVSISVPIYNVESYLQQCLDSLVNQTLKDIEIILVDDGSTDGSGAICDKYAVMDKRIIVVHKENGGLASARQAALDVATGEYFCACDADDWAESTMYEKLYIKAKNTDADIVMCNYYVNYTEKGQEIECKVRSTIDSQEKIIELALEGKYTCNIWNKLFRRDIFVKNCIQWEPGINQGEDFLMFMKVLRYPVKMVYIQDFLYHYRRVLGSNSYTNNVSMQSYRQLIRIREWLLDNSVVKKDSKGMFYLWVNLAFIGLRVKGGMTNKYYHLSALSNVPFSGFIKYRMFSMKDCVVFLTKCTHYRVGRWILSKLYKYHY